MWSIFSNTLHFTVYTIAMEVACPLPVRVYKPLPLPNHTTPNPQTHTHAHRHVYSHSNTHYTSISSCTAYTHTNIPRTHISRYTDTCSHKYIPHVYVHVRISIMQIDAHKYAYTNIHMYIYPHTNTHVHIMHAHKWILCNNKGKWNLRSGPATPWGDKNKSKTKQSWIRGSHNPITLSGSDGDTSDPHGSINIMHTHTHTHTRMQFITFCRHKNREDISPSPSPFQQNFCLTTLLGHLKVMEVVF